SPAIDFGKATAPPTDQRGIPRSGPADIAAFEVHPNLAPTINVSAPHSTQGDPATTLPVATVNDVDQQVNALMVTSQAKTGQGVALTGLTVGADGQVRAQ